MRLLGEKCKKCGSERIITKSRITPLFIIFFFLTAGLVILLLPFLGKRFKCRECGYTWRARK